MKPIEENICPDSLHSFRVNHTVLNYIDNPWHYHNDYELLYIVKGSGKRIIGDSIESFDAGDLVLLGPELPHVWKNDENYYKGIAELKSESIVIQFSEEMFGEAFLNLPEMVRVKKLMKLSARGLQIFGETHSRVIQKMWLMLGSKGLDRVITLLEMLKILSASDEMRPLASSSFAQVFYDTGSEKIRNVFAYVSENFRKDIQLDTAANIAHMSKTAFCRYFKMKTTKTFLEYLTEMRIGYACRLLAEGHMSVSQISYECGFNNPSYFNRKFKSVTGQTPLEYQKKSLNIAHSVAG